MTLEEVRDARKSTETKILDALLEFKRETGLDATIIHSTSRTITLGHNFITGHYVELKVEI